MSPDFWIGLAVGAIGSGIGIATLIVRAAQSTHRDDEPPESDEWEPPVPGRVFW